MLAHGGIIDLHTHGIGKYDTRTKNPEDILKIASLHGRAGTSAILPTIYSGTIQKMRENIEAGRKAVVALLRADKKFKRVKGYREIPKLAVAFQSLTGRR
jgi:N-acetylglucosamine-6-phosphate deacetylase